MRISHGFRTLALAFAVGVALLPAVANAATNSDPMIPTTVGTSNIASTATGAEPQGPIDAPVAGGGWGSTTNCTVNCPPDPTNGGNNPAPTNFSGSTALASPVLSLLSNPNWQATAQNMAVNIFRTLFIIELAETVVVWFFKGAGVDRILRDYIYKLIQGAVMLTLIIYYPQIMTTATNLAQSTAQQVITSGTGNGANPLGSTALQTAYNQAATAPVDPGSVFAFGLSAGLTLMSTQVSLPSQQDGNVITWESLQNPGQMLQNVGENVSMALADSVIGLVILLIVFVVIGIAFFLIMIDLFAVWIEAFFETNVGILFAGFLGSHRTKHYGEAPFKYAMNICGRIFGLYMLVAVGETFFQNAISTITGGCTVGGQTVCNKQTDLASLFAICAAAWLFLLMVRTVNKMLTTMLTGQSLAHGMSDYVAPTAAAAVAVGAAAAFAAPAIAGMASKLAGGAAVRNGIGGVGGAKGSIGGGGGGFGGGAPGGPAPASSARSLVPSDVIDAEFRPSSASSGGAREALATSRVLPSGSATSQSSSSDSGANVPGPSVSQTAGVKPTLLALPGGKPTGSAKGRVNKSSTDSSSGKGDGTGADSAQSDRAAAENAFVAPTSAATAKSESETGESTSGDGAKARLGNFVVPLVMGMAGRTNGRGNVSPSTRKGSSTVAPGPRAGRDQTASTGTSGDSTVASSAATQSSGAADAVSHGTSDGPSSNVSAGSSGEGRGRLEAVAAGVAGAIGVNRLVSAAGAARGGRSGSAAGSGGGGGGGGDRLPPTDILRTRPVGGGATAPPGGGGAYAGGGGAYTGGGGRADMPGGPSDPRTFEQSTYDGGTAYTPPPESGGGPQPSQAPPPSSDPGPTSTRATVEQMAAGGPTDVRRMVSDAVQDSSEKQYRAEAARRRRETAMREVGSAFRHIAMNSTTAGVNHAEVGLTHHR